MRQHTHGIVYYAMVYCFGDIRVWSKRNLLNFCWFSIFPNILIANISWTVAESPKNHTIFWKSVMRTFRCIYENCFQRLRFLAEVSTKLHEMHPFRIFKDHNSVRKHGSSTNDPIFSPTFATPTVCNIHICIWKKSKFNFIWSPLWPILVCKIPQFWVKATASDNPSYLPGK